MEKLYERTGKRKCPCTLPKNSGALAGPPTRAVLLSLQSKSFPRRGHSACRRFLLGATKFIGTSTVLRATDYAGGPISATALHLAERSIKDKHHLD